MSRRQRTKSRSRQPEGQTQLILRREREHQLTLEEKGQEILNSLSDSFVNNPPKFEKRLTIIQPVIANVILELKAIAAGGSGLGINAQEAIMKINNNIIRFASNESYGPSQFRRDCDDEVIIISNNNNIITEAMGQVTLSKFTGVATLGTLYMTMFWQQLQGIIQSLLAVRTSALPWMLDAGTAGLVGKIAYKELYDITAPYALNNTTFPEAQQIIAAVGLLRAHNVKKVAGNMFALADALEKNDGEELKRILKTKQIEAGIKDEEVFPSSPIRPQLLLKSGRSRLGQTDEKPLKIKAKMQDIVAGVGNIVKEVFWMGKEVLVGDTVTELGLAQISDIRADAHRVKALGHTIRKMEYLTISTSLAWLALLVFFLYRKFMSKRRFSKFGRERLRFGMKKSRKASRKRRSAKKKASRKRRSAKKKASRKRRSAKRKSRKRKSVKRKASRKRKSAKRKASRKASRKRKSAKRKASRKRKSAKRKVSRKRKSAKRKASRKRKSAKRKASRKRKSAKRKVSRKRRSVKRKVSRKSKRCPPGCVKRRSAKRKK